MQPLLQKGKRPIAAAMLFCFAAGMAAADAPAAPAAPPDDVYQAAKDLFDQYAPPEVKEQYAFPSRQDFDTFIAKLQRAIESGSLDDLAGYEPQARAALATLKASPDYADEAAWLEGKLDEIDAAQAIALGRPKPIQAPPIVVAAEPVVPYYDFWLHRLSARPPPSNAASLMPELRAAFAAEGAPPDLAWIAEAESSLRPTASSPAGARGLFQLKAETAKDLGLSTFLPDQRTDPEKSARATARYLRGLKEHFGTWPLALAAYNAGEGRIGRLLASRHASDYAEIAPDLPGETRMYVPKVCALVAVRTGRPIAR